MFFSPTVNRHRHVTYFLFYPIAHGRCAELREGGIAQPMNNLPEKYKEEKAPPPISLEQLAEQLLICSRDSLLVNMRYLDMSLNMLKLKAMPPNQLFNSITTEGKHLFYVPRYVLEEFDKDGRTGELTTRMYMHSVLMLIHLV